MKKEKYLINETDLINKIQSFLYECDMDDLARVAGELFGGECFCTEETLENGDFVFDFQPNEGYFNVFDEEKG